MQQFEDELAERIESLIIDGLSPQEAYVVVLRSAAAMGAVVLNYSASEVHIHLAAAIEVCVEANAAAEVLLAQEAGAALPDSEKN